jgi:hypothetical protein
VGDFNRDTLVDIAAPVTGGPSEVRSGVVIFPGLTKNSWGSPRYYMGDPETSPRALVAARFNSDTYPDLAVSYYRDTLKFLLNTSPGGCAPPSLSPYVKICWPSTTAVAAPFTISTSARYDGQTITYMRAYVDGVARCENSTAMLACKVSAVRGTHTITVNAWTNTGTVIKTSRTFTVQ